MMKIKRVKHSIGKYFVNNGVRKSVDESKFVLDRTRFFYVFDVVPNGKPRMTQSDKWKTDANHPDPDKRKREVVHNYHMLQNEIRRQAKQMGYEMGETLEAVFFIPMPESWSEVKKKKNLGMKCQETPDIDNLEKFFLDTFSKNDKNVWKMDTKKIWARGGSIIVLK